MLQQFCLAQSRFGWARDCMNRLVGRRRIGVIHLHTGMIDATCYEIFTLSSKRGLPTHFNPLFQIRKFLLTMCNKCLMIWKIFTSQWCGNKSDKPQKNLMFFYPFSSSLSVQTNVNVSVNVSVAHLAALLVTTCSVVWLRLRQWDIMGGCVLSAFTTRKEGSIMDKEEEDFCFKNWFNKQNNRPYFL